MKPYNNTHRDDGENDTHLTGVDIMNNDGMVFIKDEMLSESYLIIYSFKIC